MGNRRRRVDGFHSLPRAGLPGLPHDDVLPDRTAQIPAAWLREHPGAEYVCRDGSGSYGEAIRQALPEAVQVSDRWHLWSNLCGKVLAEVCSHAVRWATAVNPARPGGVREQTTRERWPQVHHLLDQGVGLLECARRLDVALNTVKRYARMKEHTTERRAPPLHAHARRPLPRPPVPAPGRGPRSAGHPPPARHRGVGLHRQ